MKCSFTGEETETQKGEANTKPELRSSDAKSNVLTNSLPGLQQQYVLATLPAAGKMETPQWE